MAICTSGEPVSPSWVANSAITWVFFSFWIMDGSTFLMSCPSAKKGPVERRWQYPKSERRGNENCWPKVNASILTWIYAVVKGKISGFPRFCGKLRRHKRPRRGGKRGGVRYGDCLQNQAGSSVFAALDAFSTQRQHKMARAGRSAAGTIRRVGHIMILRRRICATRSTCSEV